MTGGGAYELGCIPARPDFAEKPEPGPAAGMGRPGDGPFAGAEFPELGG